MAATFLARGGPALWAIAALSVAATAVTIWKIWVLSLPMGREDGAAAVDLWPRDRQAAIAGLDGKPGMAGVLRDAMGLLAEGGSPDLLRDAIETRARAFLAQLTSGARLLELTVVIAPLLGLLGTVLGMIEAFRELEAAGAQADPSLLAGGIWEALLTTAAGMTVAIPASVALAVIDARRARLAGQLEALLTRLMLGESRR